MVTKIESSSNAFYRHVKKLQTKSERIKTKQYLAEGKRAVEDAVKNGAKVSAILLCAGTALEIASSDIPIYEFSVKLFDTIKLTVHSQGIMAVLDFEIQSVASLPYASTNTILYLDTVTDPGNMGTILRSADALGVDAIVVSKGCVDIYNPKVVRSTMASLLNVPLYEEKNTDETFRNLKKHGFAVIGTFLEDSVYCCDIILPEKLVIVMGNEANGICDTIAAHCTDRAKIPMLGKAESLNVSTACSIMLYEVLRRKL